MKHKAVWGYGKTDKKALEDAKRWLKEKPHFKVNPKALIFVPMCEDTPFDDLDGLSMFDYLVFDQADQPVQMSLF